MPFFKNSSESVTPEKSVPAGNTNTDRLSKTTPNFDMKWTEKEEGPMIKIITSLIGAQDLSSFKILLMLCLTTISVASWSIPLMYDGFTENTFLIECSEAFSGGVFLQLAFGHLFVHTVQDFQAANRTDQEGFTWILAGYMCMFFLDKIMFDAPEKGVITPLIETSKKSNNDFFRSFSNSFSGSNSNSYGSDISKDSNGLSDTSVLTLVIAMSLHSAFESIVLGLSTKKKNAFVMALSVGFHLPAESIALLAACLKTSWSKEFIVKVLGAYSCTGLISAFTATVLSKYATPYIDAVVMAYTAGTFVYISTTEVVGGAFEDCYGSAKWIKFGVFLIGMGFMRFVKSLTLYLEDSFETNKEDNEKVPNSKKDE